MNPQPVEMNGEVIGVACGVCRKVAHGCEEYTAEESATWCCACSTCGEYRGKVGEPGRYFNLCRFCTWRTDFTHQWWQIGYAYSLGIQHELVWEIIFDQLDYGRYMSKLIALANREPWVETEHDRACAESARRRAEELGLVQ